jgi:hypothetical protein
MPGVVSFMTGTMLKNSLGKLKHAPLDSQGIDLICGTCFSLPPLRLSKEFFSGVPGGAFHE